MERKRHLKIGISSYTDTHTVLGVTGNAEFSGIVTALEFHGDGSNLTNITADAGAYAGTSGFATVAGYAHTAGFSTTSNYATTAGSATNATNAGSANTATAAATAYSLTGRPDIEINNLDVAGISTLDNNLNVSSLLTVDVANNKIGFNTNSPESFFEVRRDQFVARESVMLVSDGGVSQPSGVDCTLRVANDGSLPSYSVLELESDTSNFIFRNDGLTGIGTTQPSTTLDVRGTLSISGVATFKDDIYLGDGDVLRFGTGSSGFGDLQIYHDNQHSYVRDNGTGNLRLKTNNMVELVFGGTNEVMGQFIGDAGVGLYYNSSKKFETTQSGIIVTGIATADGFVGPLEGNVTGDLTGDVNAGVITAVTGNFTGNVTIGGTLTYEDVTNVDSIGIVTARDGIVVNTRGIHVLSGITTLQDLDAQDLNIRNITGSAATFTDSVSLYDNDKIFLGTSQEMEIFHGTLGNSFFTSTKPLYIKYGQSGQTHEMFIQNDSTTAAKFTDDASVELHYNGGKRLETVGGGVTVTGDLRVSGVVTATRFESTSSGTPSIDSPNNLDLNAANVAVSTDMSVGRNLTVVGFVSAANFYGDGSGLTNLPSQSYVGNAGVATYAQTAGIATLAENLTGSPAITISSATVGSTLTIQSSNIYRSNADLTLTGGGPQSTRSQLVLSNGSSATLKANDDSGSVVLKAPVGSVQVLDVGVTTSTPFLRTGAAGTVRLDRGDGNFTGVVTATTFYGDFQGSGSGITGITATYADSAGIATYASTAGVSTVSQGLSGTPDIRIDDLYVTGLSTFRDKVVINRSTTNEGLSLQYNGGYKGGLTAASAEFRVTSNSTSDLLLGCNNSGGTNGDVVIATAGVTGGYSTGWGRMAVFTGAGTAQLWHQDAKKFETTGVGATVFGTTETQQLSVSGVSTIGNVEINGNTIENTNAGGSLVLAAKANLQLRVNSASSNLAMVGNSGGSVDLYYNNAKKFETTGAGATVFGTTETQQLSVSGVSTFLDGASGEIKVYEDSDDPIIEKTGSGTLHFKTNNGFDIENGTDYLARYGSGGGGVGDGVSLFHNAIERITTTNAGVVVTGILTATSFRGDGSQLTGVLAASEAGISVQDDQSSVGVSTTIDFGTGLSVSPVSAGVVTVTSGASAGISPVIAGMIF